MEFEFLEDSGRPFVIISGESEIDGSDMLMVAKISENAELLWDSVTEIKFEGLNAFDSKRKLEMLRLLSVIGFLPLSNKRIRKRWKEINLGALDVLPLKDKIKILKLLITADILTFEEY